MGSASDCAGAELKCVGYGNGDSCWRAEFKLSLKNPSLGLTNASLMIILHVDRVIHSGGGWVETICMASSYDNI